MQLWPLFWLRARAAVRAAVQVGVGQHDERVRAAQLEHLLLDTRRGERRDASSDLARAGERDRGDARVPDQPLDLGAGHEHRPEQPIREARVAEHLLDRQRRLRHVRGVLEDGAVARHQAGTPARKTCQNGKFHGMIASTTPSGSIGDVALRDSVATGLGEEAGRVLGVEVAVQRALLDLGLGLDDRLAHLRGDQRAVPTGPFAQQRRRPAHRLGALLDGQGAPRFLRRDHLVDGLVDPRLRPRLELGQELLRGRVDRLDHGPRFYGEGPDDGLLSRGGSPSRRASGTSRAAAPRTWSGRRRSDARAPGCRRATARGLRRARPAPGAPPTSAHPRSRG